MSLLIRLLFWASLRSRAGLPAGGRAAQRQPGCYAHRTILEKPLSLQSIRGGRETDLGDSAYTVIGVLPASFRFGSKPDVVMPLRLDAQSAPEHLNFLRVIGKLRPGIRLTQGRSAMQTLFPIYQKADRALPAWY